MAPRNVKLESSLARCDELTAGGQNAAALEMLGSLVLNTKYPMNFVQGPSSSGDLEQLTLKIVHLGIELRRGRLIKEVLFHLRGALQAVGGQVFETVLSRLMMEAEGKLNEAAKNAALAPTADLEEDSGAVLVASSEDSLLLPSLRFYWEILRGVLELTRNNPKLERIYHAAASKAFDFCRRFNRSGEFKRLAEMLRHHLALSLKYAVAGAAAASDAGSNQLALELRFAQLATAEELQLWQEAFRTIEDIYSIHVSLKKSIRDLTAPEYFKRVARIFAKSDNFLFLGATLLPQPGLNLTERDSLVLAALAAPIDDFAGESHDSWTESSSARLATIIGLSAVPTRQSLVKAVSEDSQLLAESSVEVRELFGLMTQKSSLASIAMKAVETLSRLSGDHLRPFLRPCFSNLLRAVLLELGRNQETVSLKELKTMLGIDLARASFAPKFNLEAFLVLESGRSDSLRGLKIDHCQEVVEFDRERLISEPQESFESLHCRLSRLSGVQDSLLASLRKSINVASLAAEHAARLERRTAIERRKEHLEAAAVERERAEARERAARAQAEAEAGQRRQAEETARRDSERLECERAEIRRVEAEKRLVEQEKMKEAAGARLNRERLGQQGYRMDYLERALREAEIPLLEADYTRQQEADQVAHETRKSLILDVARVKHARDLELKKKLDTDSSTLAADLEKFRETLFKHREEEFVRRSEVAAAALETEKAKRLERAKADLLARRQIEAERAQRHSATAAASAPAVGIAEDRSPATSKYVPPASRATWRREDASPSPASAAVNEEAARIESSTYVPRHRRQ